MGLGLDLHPIRPTTGGLTVPDSWVRSTDPPSENLAEPRPPSGRPLVRRRPPAKTDQRPPDPAARPDRTRTRPDHPASTGPAGPARPPDPARPATGRSHGSGQPFRITSGASPTGDIGLVSPHGVSQLSIADQSDPGLSNELSKAAIGHQKHMVRHSFSPIGSDRPHLGVSMAGRSVSSVTPGSTQPEGRRRIAGWRGQAMWQSDRQREPLRRTQADEQEIPHWVPLRRRGAGGGGRSQRPARDRRRRTPGRMTRASRWLLR